MKNLFKALFTFAIVATTFTSCMKKDNTDYDAINLEEDKRVEALLTEQKILIEAYVNSEFENPVEDTVLHRLSFLGKTVKRGIWYEERSEPTDNSYEYRLNNNGTAVIWPKVKIKYTATLLDGTIVQSDEAGSDYTFSNPNLNVMNNVWVYAFFPYSIRFNGNDEIIGGLTKDGLKKGSIFRMVTPSYWAFDTRANIKDIPADSPLIYEFEVLAIE